MQANCKLINFCSITVRNEVQECKQIVKCLSCITVRNGGAGMQANCKLLMLYCTKQWRRCKNATNCKLLKLYYCKKWKCRKVNCLSCMTVRNGGAGMQASCKLLKLTV
jgi:hypothetical protein